MRSDFFENDGCNKAEIFKPGLAVNAAAFHACQSGKKTAVTSF